MMTLTVLLLLTAIVLLIKILTSVTEVTAPDLSGAWSALGDLIAMLIKLALWLGLVVYAVVFIMTLFGHF